MLIKSFLQLRATNPGFDPTHASIADITVPRVHYSEPEKQLRFFRELMPKLAALPGVEAAGGVNPLPFSGRSARLFFHHHGAGCDPARRCTRARRISRSSQSTFRAMQIPVLAGRAFNERDDENARTVIIVNQAFAPAFFA